MGADIDGEAAGDHSGISVSLNSDGTIVAIGAHGNDGNGSGSGHVRVYQYNGSSWDQLGADIDGETAGDKSGYSVSLSADGTIVAIGAYGNDGNGTDYGHVRIYQWNGSSWNQLGNDIDGEAAGNYFGRAVSLSKNGSVLVVGAYNYNSAQGRTYTYELAFSDTTTILDLNTPYVEYGISVSHNKQITETIENPSPKDTCGNIVDLANFYNKRGIYTFTYSATDVDGKTSYIDRIVKVVDNVAPIINISGGDVYLITGYIDSHGLQEFLDYGLVSVIDNGGDGAIPVSYTHLTLPTNREV